MIRVCVKPRQETKFNKLWLQMFEKFVCFPAPILSEDGRTYNVKFGRIMEEPQDVISIEIKKHAYREMEYYLHLANGDTARIHVLSKKKMPQTLTEEVFYSMGRMHFQNEEPGLEAVFDFYIDPMGGVGYEVLFYDAYTKVEQEEDKREEMENVCN